MFLLRYDIIYFKDGLVILKRWRKKFCYMINFLLCDDDKNFLNIVEENLKNILVADFSDLEYNIFASELPEKALELGIKHFPEILLLDIDIPGSNGFDIAAALKEKGVNAKNIFISNYEDFVYDSFKFNAFRFIRKLHMENELKEAVCSAINEIAIDNGFMELPAKYGNGKILYSQISYIESKRNYIEINTLDNKKYLHRTTLKEIYEKLKKYNFVQIHSGFLVSMRNIRYLHKDEIEMANGIFLKASRKYYNDFKKRYFEYLRK